ncbi:Na(+) H(+) antiporter subunit B [hydrothermal vent metagenome]|uniref:Na(+) H(+) antiporter subunit B n=1 Tax=hydrothermal vent metagenome TaxID=652676 RepID=A0A3B0RIW4_9ZZZZ
MFITPFIQLFALYVIAHGDISPGGGFQGGVIIGASVILYVIAFGLKAGRERVSEILTDFMNSIGVMIYAGIGLACLIMGGAYLEYTKLAGSAGVGQGSHAVHALHLAGHLGIYGIEIGIGMVVASVMITIFFETANTQDDD